MPLPSLTLAMLSAMPAAGVAIAASASLRNALDELKNLDLCSGIYF
ncbi:MAG: hypothetical protein HWQ43_07635 [Nostoc sp. JL31]|nr:hypothetical protein [Nostoc sp. JL31]MBN3889038.1 hypothetical protein [Nostoc sp. JL31]